MKTIFTFRPFKSFLLMGLLFISTAGSAASYYWVGGTGVWSDLTHWATSSGGGVNHAIVPSPADDVFFDGNSFPSTGGTVTINFEAFCRDFTVATDLDPNVIFNFNTGLNINRTLSAIPSTNKLTWNQVTKLIIANGATLDNVFLNMTSGEFRIQAGNLVLEDQAYFKKQGWVDLCYIDNGTVSLVSGSKFEQFDGYFIAGNGNLIIPSGATFQNNAHNKEIKNGKFHAQSGSIFKPGRRWYITNGGYVLDAAAAVTFIDYNYIYLRSTTSGSHSIGCGGRDISRVELDGTNYGTEYHLIDNLVAKSDGLFMYANKFFSDGYGIDVYHFYNWNCGVTTINVSGTDTIRVVGQFRLNNCPSNLTLNLGSAVVKLQGNDHQYVYCYDKTLNDIIFNSLSTGDIQIYMEGNFTADDVTIRGNGRQYLRMRGNHTFNNFNYDLFNSSATATTNEQQIYDGSNTFTGNFTFNAANPNSKHVFYFGSNNTFNVLDFNSDISEWRVAAGTTQTFTDLKDITGTCAKPVKLHTGSTSSQATFTQSTGGFVGDWFLLQSIKVTTGLASWTANNTIDLGNNTGWTISGVSAQTFYWIGGAGNWNDATHWSLTSGGSAGCAIPSQIDNVIFDVNSFSASGQRCTVNVVANCYDMKWDNVFPGSGWMGGFRLNLYGNICKFDANMVDSKGEYIFFKNNSTTGTTIETEGITLNTLLYFEGGFNHTPKWTLLDDLKSNTWVYLAYGKFISNGKNLDVYSYWVYDNGATSDFTGTTLIKLQNYWRLWYNSVLIMPSNCNILFSSANHQYFHSQGISTSNRKTYGGKIIFENTSTGGHESLVQGHYNTYNVITLNHNGNGRFYMDHSYIAIDSLVVNYYRNFATTQNVQIYTDQMSTNYFKVTGTALNHPNLETVYNNSYGEAVFNNLNSWKSWNGYTRSFAKLTITSGCNPKTIIQSITPGTQANVSVSGTATCDNCILQDINAIGGGTFTSTNSGNNGNVSGWSTGSGSNYYWIGGTGNWNDPNEWSFSSGGSPAGCIPSRIDNVFFDVNSFTAAGQTVTIQNGMECKSMLWNGVNNPIVNGNDGLNVYGSFILASNVTWNHANWVYFQSRNTGNVINTNGVPLRYVQFYGEATYAGEWTLQGDLKVQYYIYFRSGTFKSNGYAIDAGYLWNDFNDNRIKMDFTGTSEIKIRGRVHFYPNTIITASNTDFRFNNAIDAFEFHNYGKTVKNVIIEATNTNNIQFYQTGTYNNVTITSNVWPNVYFHHGGTYNDISITYNNTTTNIPQIQFNSSTTVNNLTVTSTGNGGPHLYLNQNNTFNNLIAAGPGTRLLLGANRTQTVNSLLALGNGSYPIFVKSLTAGTQATIHKPSGKVCLDFVLMQDVKATSTSPGSTQFFAGASSVNLGNNTNWMFSSCDAYYWVGDNGNWSDYANHWATSSGGTNFHTTVPGYNDDVFFDANSFTTTGRTVTVDVPIATSRDMKWGSAVFTPTFAGNSEIKIYGDLELISGMNQNFTGDWKFMATDTGHVIATGGRSLFNAHFLGGSSGMGAWRLSDPFNVINDLNFDNGTLNTNGKDVNTKNFNSSTSNSRSLKLLNSTVTINNGSWKPSTLTNSQLLEGTSTIKITGTGGSSSFNGNGLTYNNATFTTSSTLTAALTGANTFNTLRIDKGLTLNVDPVTETMSSLIADGTCANTITIQSSSPGNQATFSKSGGTVNTQFLTLKDMIGAGGATWNANYSTDAGNNTNWNFTAPPTLSITVTATDVSCSTNNDGTATVTAVSGGVSPYTYLWSTTETTAGISNLIPGTYSVKVTDGAGCFVTQNVVAVNEPSDITPVPFSASAYDICLGTTINFTAGSPSQSVTSYKWNFGDFTTSTAQNPSKTYSAGGTYTVTLQYLDASSCPATTSAVIRVSNIALSIQSTNVLCNGQGNGTITITATGGVAPYQYSINGGTNYFSSGSFTNLGPGTYSIKVKDTINCIKTSTVTITQPTSALSASVSKVNVSCAGTNDGSITITASGGTSPYNYSINNGILFVTTNSFPNLTSGTYNVVARDANNCVTSAQSITIGVTDNVLPTITCPSNTTVTPVSGCTANVTVPAPVTGDNCGVASVINNYNNTGNASDVYPIGTTNVIWTVTDVNNNTQTCTMTVTVNGPEISVTGNGNAVADGSASVSTTNNTDFGSTATSVTKTFMVTNTGTSNLTINTITTTGAHASDFMVNAPSLPLTIAGGGNITFNITFTPSGGSTRTATVNIGNSDCDESTYDYGIQGFGNLPAKALNFDGTNDYIEIPHSTSLSIPNNALTLETWVRPGSSEGVIIQKWNTGQEQYSFQLNYQGYFQFFVSTNNGLQGVSSSNPIPANQWSHLAATYDGVKLKVYVNGALSNNVNLTSGTVINSGTNVIRIGSRSFSVSDMFNGSIDEMRIWNRALCQGEIQNNLNCELSGSQTDLAAYYKLNHGYINADNSSITTASDASGNGNNGTLTNFALTGTSSNWVAGNVSGTCSAFVPPTAGISGTATICSGNSTTITFTGTANAVVIYNVNGGSDQTITLNGSGSATLSVSPTVNSTYTPTSVISSTSCITTLSGSATVTVNTAPIFTACPSNISASNATGVCNATVNYTATATGTPSPTISYAFTGATSGSGSGTGSGSIFNVGITNVTVTANNSCGTATCSFTVTINDTENPTITCPANVTRQCGTSTDPSATGYATATDNCGATTVSYSDNSTSGSFLYRQTWESGTGGWYSKSGTGDPVVLVSDPTAPSPSTVHKITSCESGGHYYSPLIQVVPGQTYCFSLWIRWEGGCWPFLGIDRYNAAGTILGENWLIGQAGFADNFGGTVTPVPNTASGWNFYTKTVTIPAGVTQIRLKNEMWSGASKGGATLGYFDNIGFTNGSCATSGFCTQNYQIQRTWTATDGSGNTSSCQQTITVVDNMPPVINCPANITIQCNTSTAPAATGTSTATDNCSTPAIGYSDVRALTGCGGTGTITRTWTATDECGNRSTCIQTITVIDNQPPQLVGTIPPGQTGLNLCFNAIPAGPTAATIGALYTDNCSTVSVTKTGIPTGNNSGWTVTYQYVIKDACNNAANAVDITYSGADMQNPTVTCPSNISANTATGLCTASVVIPTVIFGDNCTPAPTLSWSTTGATTLSGTGQPGTKTFDKGVTTVNLVVTDAANLTATCSFTVTVNDTELPRITCPSPITQTNDAGICGAVVTYTAPVGTDNCTGSTTVQTAGLASGSTFPKGTTTNTFVVTDASNNTATCSFTVTVTDNESPTITCSANVTINTTTGQCTGTTTLAAPTVSDNCSSGYPNALDFDGSDDYISFSQNLSSVTNFTYETWVYPRSNSAWQRILDFGNSAGLNIFFTNSYDGAGRPRFVINIGSGEQQLSSPNVLTLNSWQHIAVTLGGGVAKMYINGSLVTQNNSFSYTPSSLGNTSNNWIGRSQYNDPLFNGKLDEIRFWNVTRTASDISSNMNAELGAQSGLLAVYHLNQGTAGGTNTGINTAIDASGNNRSGTLNNFALTGSTSNWVSGKSLGLTITNNAPATYPVGNTTVTWTATDASNNSATCTQTVTVIDNQNPTITCPSNIIVSNDAGICGAVVNYTAPVGTDNCTGSTTVQTAGLVSGSTFPKGVTTNTFKVTDASGLTATCSFTVTVNDTELPKITCPSNITQSTDAGVCNARVTYSTPVGTDNCPGSTTVQIAGFASGSNFPKGITTNTFKVTDASGLTATCSFTVTVNDTELPKITCPSPITKSNDAGICGAVVNYGTQGMTLYASSSTGTNPGSLFTVNTSTGIATLVGANGTGLGSNRLTSLAQDPTSGLFYGIIGDSRSEGLYLIKVNTSTGAGTLVGMVSGSGFNGSPGVGGGDALVFSTSGTLYISGWGGGFGGGSFLRVDKTNGNVLQANSVGAEYTGLKFHPTTGVLWASRGGNNPGNIHTINPSNGAILTTLSLSNSSARITDLAFHSNGTLYGSSGGSVNDLVTINTSTGAVTIIGNFGSVVQNVSGLGFFGSSGGSIGATDNCTTVTVTQTAGLASGSTFPIGTTTNTFVATDASGNTATCSFTVTVNDTELPKITCPSNITKNNDAGICGAVATYSVTSTDNCTGQTITQTAGLASGSTFPVGTTINTFVVTDASNNTATCSFTVTVNDNEKPVLSTCPSNVTVSAVSNTCSQLHFWSDPTFTDNCTGTTLTVGSSNSTVTIAPFGPQRFAIFPVGTTTVTYTATDASGNISTCSFTVTVTDNQNPTITGCPSDITINNKTGDCSNQAFWNPPTASDNCSGVSMTGSHIPGNTFPVGTTTVTYTATDASNNTATCTFKVIVADNERPAITCAANQTQTADARVCSAAVTVIAPATSDNCGVAGVTNNYNNTANASGTYPVGTTTILWTVTDIYGNTNTCTQTVTITDNERPTITCPSDVTVNCERDNTSAATGTATATDNCDPAPVITQSQTSTYSSDATNSLHYNYLITRTWRATDVTGNYSECVQRITVEDVTKPTITCPRDLTVNCQDDNTSTATGTATATDNCDPAPNITQSQTSTYSSDATNSLHYNYLITRTWRATDVTGNYSECVQRITVEDVTKPTITCPRDLTVNCQDDNTSTATGTATATDNCDPAPVITQSQTSTYSSDATNSLHYNYVITRTWRATDVTGNYSECVQRITVEDVTKPTITCPRDLTVNCQDDNTSTATGTATATDNCDPAPVITQSQTSTYSSDATNSLHYNYLITRTWRATDVTGNYSECVQRITVEDVTKPTITCPRDLTVNCQDDNTSTATGTATATDNCDPASVITQSQTSTYSSDATNSLHYNYLITRTWRATDVTGNYSECVQRITVEDVTKPTITCPRDLTVNCQDDNTSTATGTATATDNCDPAPVITQSQTSTYSSDATNSLHYNYLITRTWRATDVTGNYSECVQRITVEDVTKPTITCPRDLTVNCQDDNTSTATGTATATDNCDPAPVITQSQTSTYSSDATNSLHYNYLITRTWRATDVIGNYSECVQKITVEDVTKPTITCPRDLTVNCQDDNTSTATGTATATDNCDPAPVITQSQTSTYSSDATNSLHYNYLITRTWRATDVTGNYSECVQRITVEDVTKPTITCPRDLTVNCQDDNTSTATGTATATDNCDPAPVITQSQTSTYSSDATNSLHYNYVITRTWRATDLIGNYSECVQKITVQDVIRPTITCPSDVTVNCQDDNTSTATGTATATDNCDPAPVITQSQTSTYSSDATNILHYNYVITRTWRATDVTGNYSECVQRITVEDVTKPTITCPRDLTVNCQDDNTSTATGTATATDNCDPASVITQSQTSTYSSDATNSLHYNYLITRTWRATDVTGNYSECVQRITVEDVTKPTITCPRDLTVNCQDDNTSTATGTATATDNCDPAPVITQSQTSTYSSDATNSLHYNYLITRTWRATDVTGNYSECVQRITVEDVTKPTITCPRDLTVNCQDDNTSTATGTATATDNCDPAPVITQSQTSTYSSDATNSLHYNYLITRTWRATDVIGNYSECVQKITVEDVTKPTITCPRDLTVNCQDDNTSTATGTATATDNCDPAPVITQSQTSTYSSDATNSLHYNYVITRTWRATDLIGNYSECVQKITVQDVIRPTITCPSDVTVNCQDDNTSTATGTATATDNCDPAPVITQSQTSTYSTDVTNAAHYNYVITRTWRATDVIGNYSECVQKITVQDVTRPTITCPSDKTVNCQDDNTSTATGTATATDNCDPAPAITQSQTSTYSTDATNAAHYNYVITRTWRATDVIGNYSECIQKITVEDVTKPTITCPSDKTVNCQDDNTSTATGTATATDNCDPAPDITQSQTSTYSSDATNVLHYNYVITRTWRATDVIGNYSECVQKITVQDVTKPTAKCKNVTITLVNGAASITAADINNNSIDNCDNNVSLSVSKTTFDCSNIGANTVTLTVTDVTGNYSTCDAVVTVSGTIPSCSISVKQIDSIYTGGVSTHIYLGYGAQKATLRVHPTGGSGFTYSWSPSTYLSSDNSQTPVFTPTSAGTFTYTVTVTNSNGCITTGSVTFCVKDIVVSGTSGSGKKVYICHIPPGNTNNPQTLSISVNAVSSHIGDHEGDKLGKCGESCTNNKRTEIPEMVIDIDDLEIIYAPNPYTHSFKLIYESNSGLEAKITIYGITGNLVQTATAKGYTDEVELGKDLPNGIYTVSFIQGNKNKIFKIIKMDY